MLEYRRGAKRSERRKYFFLNSMIEVGMLLSTRSSLHLPLALAVATLHWLSLRSSRPLLLVLSHLRGGGWGSETKGL